jgi:hypothetical protein
VAITTPAAQQIEWLWPGEPKRVNLEMSDRGPAQVAHLTIGGYPRRELLRAISHHSGGPLQQTDIFSFVEQAKKASASKPAQATASGLKDFAKVILADKSAVGALKSLGDALAKAGKVSSDAVMTQELITPTESALSRIRFLAMALPGDQQKALDAMLPKDGEVQNAPGPTYIFPLATNVYQLVQTLTAGTPSASASSQSQPDADLAAATLCSIANEVVPLVSEDILIRGQTESKDPFVLEYDFGGGFQLSTPRPLWDTDPIFIVVRNVQPGWSVGVVLGNRSIVQRDATLVGLPRSSPPAPSTTFEERTSQSRPGFDTLKPLDREMQPPGTQILPIGRLSGSARYDVTVCASDSATDDCSAPSVSSSVTKTSVTGGGTAGADAGMSTAGTVDGGGALSPNALSSVTSSTVTPNHRTIAKNSLQVHSKHYLGVRAGFGGVFLSGTFQDTALVPGVAGSVVRRQTGQGDFMLPLLLNYYFGGRDTTELSTQVSWGIAAGIDLLKLNPDFRLYAGPTFDVGGVGLTLMATAGRVPYVSAAQGTVVASSSAVQTDTVWRYGGGLAMTTDLDIFEAVFQNFFNPPSLPTATPPSGGGQ